MIILKPGWLWCRGWLTQCLILSYIKDADAMSSPVADDFFFFFEIVNISDWRCNLTIYNSPLIPCTSKKVSVHYSCTFIQKMELISTLRKLQFVSPPTWASFRNFKICEEYKANCLLCEALLDIAVHPTSLDLPIKREDFPVIVSNKDTIIHVSKILPKTWVENYCFFECVCVLSHLSHVWLFSTLWTITRHETLSMGFSRKEY